MTAVATVGSLSRDVVAGASPRPGGAAFYAARAFAHIGADDARVIARCGADDASDFLPQLEAFGVPVTFRAGNRTTAFTFHYEGDRRIMHVDAVGDPWTVEDATGWVDDAIAGAEWVQVGALLRSDFPDPTLAALARGRRLLVDAQGLVRSARTGPLDRTGDVSRDTLRVLTAIKLNEDEARVLVGGLEPELLRRLAVPEILLTLGSAGALVVTEAHAERIDPIELAGVVDPTGAGDSFTAAYVHHRARGAEPVDAARAANALAAEVLRGGGQR